MKLINSIGIVLFVALLFLHCAEESSQSNQGENSQLSEQNEVCVLDCASEYLDQLPSCESESSACLEDCDYSGNDDGECIEACDECFETLDFSTIDCLANCPCNVEYFNCQVGCDLDDDLCDEKCGNLYEDCAGDEPIANSVSTCIGERWNCISNCEEYYGTILEFTDCQDECIASLYGCVSEIGNLVDS